MNKSRTIDDVLSFAEHAKLNKDDLLKFSQCLYFDPSYGEQSNLKLLEINSEIFNAIKKGDDVIIRGDSDDPSVLCTQDKTYEIREAETSNALVIIPGLNLPSECKHDSFVTEPQTVTSIHHKYLELRPCKPKINKLRQMLKENLYNGELKESDDKSFYNFQDLLNKVQGSEQEIEDALQEMKAYKIDGYWRLLDFKYHYYVLDQILSLIESNSWELDKVSISETIQSLKSIIPQNIIKQCFKFCFIPSDDDDICRVNDKIISRMAGELLLYDSGKFNLDDFVNIWQQSVPNGIISNLSHLEGICLVDKSSPASIRYFPSSDLPEESIHRFQMLFDAKDKWTYEEIKPFLEEISSNQSGVQLLLAKHCRTSTQGGVKCYSSKHSK